MAYTSVPEVVDGQTAPSADWWNTYIRDNMAAMFPEAATAKGDILAATGNDAAAVVTVGEDGAYLFADNTQAAGVKWSLLAAARHQGTASTGVSVEDGWEKMDNYNGSESFDTTASMSITGIFTAPHPGYYVAIAAVKFVPESPAVNDFASIALFKNDTMYGVVDTAIWDAADNINQIATGADVVYLDTGDTLSVYVYGTDTGSGSVFAWYDAPRRFSVMAVPV